MRRLLLLLLLLPALEIGVFIWAGARIGPWWVVALIIITGLAGLMIAKREGLETWHRVQQSINAGQTPVEHLADGICILIGGILLFSPGFITDTAGFILVIPITRGWFKRIVLRFIKRLIEGNQFIFHRW